MTKYNRAGGAATLHFLLTDTNLMMTELHIISSALKFRRVFKLTDMKFTFIELHAEKRILIETPTKSFQVGFSTPKECTSWYSSLIEATKAARHNEGLPSNYEDSLKFSVVWGKNTKDCQVCGRSFSIIVRRHHCRSCGKCICGSCSFEKVRMEGGEDGKLQRVCNFCKDEIKERRALGYGKGQTGYGAGGFSETMDAGGCNDEDGKG